MKLKTKKVIVTQKIKKLFQLVVTLDKDELSEKNLHIDIDDNANELNTGMLKNALDVNTSGDTDIILSRNTLFSDAPQGPLPKTSDNT